jgi:hypothetical protein
MLGLGAAGVGVVAAVRDDVAARREAVVVAAVPMGSGRKSSGPGARARPSVLVTAVAVLVGAGRRVSRSAAGGVRAITE